MLSPQKSRAAKETSFLTGPNTVSLILKTSRVKCILMICNRMHFSARMRKRFPLMPETSEAIARGKAAFVAWLKIPYLPAGKSERDGLRIGNSSLQICILRSGIILSELADISRVFTLADTLFRDLRLIKRFLLHQRYSAGAAASAGGASMSATGWIGITASAAGTYSTCSSLFSASALRISVPSSTRTNAPTVVRSPVVKG